MKILFFLESLHSGGKERRAVELFHYLRKNTDIEFQIVLTEEEIHYTDIGRLRIPIYILRRRFGRKDPFIFFRFFDIVREFEPDIIHAWGGMTTLYAIPSAKFFNIILINSQIADAIPKKYRSFFMNLVWSINHHFSDYIFTNSEAGLKVYNVRSEKGKVIHNGIRLERFDNMKSKEEVREDFNIRTPYVIIMVAGFSKYKDYDLFFDIANKVCKIRGDVTFLAVGEGETRGKFVEKFSSKHILFTGRIAKIEELINACDIGVLFSQLTTGEGISNAIMEYMALSKPVIATDAGGTKELVDDKNSGYLVKNVVDIIIGHINVLLDNQNLRIKMGEKGRRIIESGFTINKMGAEFCKLYGSIKKKVS